MNRLTVAAAMVMGLHAQARVRGAFFNWNDQKSFIDPLRGFQRQGDDLQKVLLTEIAKAKHSIEVAVYQLNLPDVALALVAKKQQGVQVRVVVDNAYSQPISDLLTADRALLSDEDLRRLSSYLLLADVNQDGQVSPNEILHTDAMAILRNGQVPVIDDTAGGGHGSAIMHNKFLIVDRKVVVTGSANFTTSDMFGDVDAKDTRGNANSMIAVEDENFAEVFYHEFAVMWGEVTGTPAFGKDKPREEPSHVKFEDGTEMYIQFAPGAADLITEALDQTQRSADLGLFVFSAQSFSNQLQKLSQSGGLVRAIIDGGFAYRWYSELLDMLGLQLRDERCRFESDNAPWQRPLTTVGAARLPEGDKFHHKFAVLDDVRIIYGSFNWSANAELNNDETLIHMYNPPLAKAFKVEFERHYRRAYLGVKPWLQEQVDEHNNTCRPFDN